VQQNLQRLVQSVLSPLDSTARRLRPLALAPLLLLLLGANCKRVPTPTMDRATCQSEINEAFLPQDMAVFALRPADGGTVFRSEVLEAIERVCTAFEDEQTDFELAVKCLTSVPLMESRKNAPPRQIMIRDELPAPSEPTDHRLETATRGLEFATGDVISEDATVAYGHVPLVSFDGVDLRAIFATALGAEPLLTGAIDTGAPEDVEPYVALAGDGPGARAIIGLYDAGMDGALKEPVHLQALEAFQARAEGLKTVAETFTVVDDLKVVRKGLRGGNQEAYTLPKARPEAAQLLLALTMSPAAKYGARIDGRERVALIRVNLSSLNDAEYARTVRKLEQFLGAETAEGATAFLCTDNLPAPE